MASEVPAARLLGGVLLAAGALVLLLGGLCANWLVVPELTRSWQHQGTLKTLDEFWPFVAGAAATMAVGALLAGAGLRIIRDHVVREAGDDPGSDGQK